MSHQNQSEQEASVVSRVHSDQPPSRQINNHSTMVNDHLWHKLNLVRMMKKRMTTRPNTVQTSCQTCRTSVLMVRPFTDEGPRVGPKTCWRDDLDFCVERIHYRRWTMMRLFFELSPFLFLSLHVQLRRDVSVFQLISATTDIQHHFLLLT
jgi:hypothetical protein